MENTNDYFQLNKLRRRSKKGNRVKADVRLTIMPETISMLDNIVGFGKGKYSSPLMDLATRFLLELATSGEDLPQIVHELKEKCISPYLINNIERLNRMIKV